MNVKNPHVIWASVSIVFMLIAGAITLVALGKDVTVILALAGAVAVPVLGGFGVAVYQKMDGVDTKVNGNTSDMLKMINNLHDSVRDLALQVSVPAPATDDPDKTQVVG
jgi:hypothetical protein